MCEKASGSVFLLTALHMLPSHASVHILFPKLFFFPMTVFEKENIRKSELTWLKINNSRNAVCILAVFTAGI